MLSLTWFLRLKCVEHHNFKVERRYNKYQMFTELGLRKKDLIRGCFHPTMTEMLKALADTHRCKFLKFETYVSNPLQCRDVNFNFKFDLL